MVEKMGARHHSAPKSGDVGEGNGHGGHGNGYGGHGHRHSGEGETFIIDFGHEEKEEEEEEMLPAETFLGDDDSDGDGEGHAVLPHLFNTSVTPS
jgi:hypothetical protein